MEKSCLKEYNSVLIQFYSVRRDLFSKFNETADQKSELQEVLSCIEVCRREILSLDKFIIHAGIDRVAKKAFMRIHKLHSSKIHQYTIERNFLLSAGIENVRLFHNEQSLFEKLHKQLIKIRELYYL